MEASQRLKANLKLKGQPCAACGRELDLGEDVAICNACQGNHHASCWDQAGGCATGGCSNAPLAQLAPEPQARYGMPPAQHAAPPGMRPCPHCGTFVAMEQQICGVCNNICSLDGTYRGPRQNAPGALASLVYGILGMVICGLIFGLIAITKSNEARRLIESDPRYQGEGLASAGKVLGIIALILWGIGFLRLVAAFLSSWGQQGY